MCFALDSVPPIRPLAGVAVDRTSLTLRASDGNEYRAFHARPAERTGNAIVILPDVRGLHHYYEELAARFAEMGVEAVAIDYFGRTAGTSERGDDFDYQPHVAQTTWPGISADIAAASAFLRSKADGGDLALFTIGFCLGGRNSFLSATLGLGLAGSIGFYGFPGGASRNGSPAPSELVDLIEAPILGIFGGADQAIPIAMVQEFRDRLEQQGVANEIAVEPNAPHGFFDRKADEFAAQSEDAWNRVRHFIDEYGAA